MKDRKLKKYPDGGPFPKRVNTKEISESTKIPAFTQRSLSMMNPGQLADIMKLSNKKKPIPYSPNKIVESTKAKLAAASLIPYYGYIPQLVGVGADLETAGRYAIDGNWKKANEDVTQALIGLIPGSKFVGLGVKGEKIYKTLKGVSALKAASDVKTINDAEYKYGGNVKKYFDGGPISIPGVWSPEAYQVSPKVTVPKNIQRKINTKPKQKESGNNIFEYAQAHPFERALGHDAQLNKVDNKKKNYKAENVNMNNSHIRDSVVNAAMSVDASNSNFFRNSLPVPANVQQMLAKNFNKDARMNNNSLSDDQKLILADVIDNAKKRTGKPNGGTSYEDYQGEYGTKEQFNDWFNKGSISTMGLLNSGVNPGFTLASTIGRGKYYTDPKTGNDIYTDVYDWNSGEKNYKGDNLYQKIRNNVRSNETKNLNEDKNNNYRMNFVLDKEEIKKLREQKIANQSKGDQMSSSMLDRGFMAQGGSVPNPSYFNTDQDYQNAMYRHQLDNLTLPGQNNFIPSPKFPVFQQNGMFDDGTQFQSLRPENEMPERNRLSNANPELITSQSLRQASPTIDPNRAPTNLIPPKKKNALGEIGDFLKDYKSQAITLGLGFLGNVTDRDKNDRKQMMINGSSDSLYSTNTGSRGDWSVNEGKLKLDQNVFSQFSANPLNEYGIPRAALGMAMDNSLTSSVNYSAGLMPGTTQSAIPEFNMPSRSMMQTSIQEYTNESAPLDFSKSGTDVATKTNNPGNMKFHSWMTKVGGSNSGIPGKDGGTFAQFPDIQTGLKAYQQQLFGTVDGIMQSSYYKPNTTVDQALKTWSNNGYGADIYPELKGKTLSEVSPEQRLELSRRQIKKESGKMYSLLNQSGVFGVNQPLPNFVKSASQFANQAGFDVTSTTEGKHNTNSKHYNGNAIDVRTKNKSDADIQQFIATAKQKGFKVLDERNRPAGQRVWGGPHLHLETYSEGGEYEMNSDELNNFLKNGGQVEYL